jgi:hypothetical protein
VLGQAIFINKFRAVLHKESMCTKHHWHVKIKDLTVGAATDDTDWAADEAWKKMPRTPLANGL